MVQVAELQRWQHHYFSLVVQQGVKQYFTVVGQKLFCCCLFYAIATLFHLYYDSDMMYTMRRRMHDPTPLLTQGTFNLPHHIGMVWEELAFDDPVSYTQQWQSKLAEVMTWGIKPPTFRLRLRMLTVNHSATEDTTSVAMIADYDVAPYL